MTQITTDDVLNKSWEIFLKKPSSLLTERNFSDAIIDILNKDLYMFYI